MAFTMQQAVNSKMAFNPLASPDGQGELYTGRAQSQLAASMAAHGWDDPRFLSEEQVKAAGWALVKNPMPVQITFKPDPMQAHWDNKKLFNAVDIVGMPSLEDMLAVAKARLTPVVEVESAKELAKESPAVSVADVVPAAGLSASQVHEQELWNNFSVEHQREVMARALADRGDGELDGAALGVDDDEELIVGPGRRKVVDQEEELAVSPVVREKAVDVAGPQVDAKLPVQEVGQVAVTLLNSRFKERVAGSGEYVREGEKKVAFLDKGGSLVIRDKQQDSFQAVMELAKSKGWQEIELSGKKESIARGWLEAQLQGITVTNYTPTEQDLVALDKRRAEVAVQPVAVPSPVLANGAKVVSQGLHVGQVIDARGGYVFQRTGRSEVVAHEVGRFDGKPPEVGDKVDVQYQGGRALVKEGRGVSAEVGRGREVGGR